MISLVVHAGMKVMNTAGKMHICVRGFSFFIYHFFCND